MSHCQICRSTLDDEAQLCWPHTAELETAIAELPAYLHELRAAVMRQTRVYRAAPARRADLDWVDPEASLAARLRSLGGRVALPANPLPVDLDASRLNSDAWSIIGEWMTRAAEITGRRLPTTAPREIRRHLYLYRNRMHWWVEYSSPGAVAETVCTWLVATVDELRTDQAAGRAYRQLIRLRRRLERAVDMHPPANFAGLCEAEDVRVEPLLRAGPPCSTLTCAHATCDDIRRGTPVLSPRTTTCSTELYFDGTDEITCEACGAVYDVAERKSELLSRIPDVIAGTRSIASGLSTLAARVTESMIRQMAFRNEIVDRGNDPDSGHPLYRVGDVMAVLERRRRAKSERDERRGPRRRHAS